MTTIFFQKCQDEHAAQVLLYAFLSGILAIFNKKEIFIGMDCELIFNIDKEGLSIACESSSESVLKIFDNFLEMNRKKNVLDIKSAENQVRNKLERFSGNHNVGEIGLRLTIDRNNIYTQCILSYYKEALLQFFIPSHPTIVYIGSEQYAESTVLRLAGEKSALKRREILQTAEEINGQLRKNSFTDKLINIISSKGENVAVCNILNTLVFDVEEPHDW